MNREAKLRKAEVPILRGPLAKGMTGRHRPPVFPQFKN
jgi:hypothetical protein